MLAVSKDIAKTTTAIFTVSLLAESTINRLSFGQYGRHHAASLASSLILGGMYLWRRCRERKYFNEVHEYEKQRQVRRYAIVQSLHHISLCCCGGCSNSATVSLEVTRINRLLDDPTFPEDITSSHWYKQLHIEPVSKAV